MKAFTELDAIASRAPGFVVADLAATGLADAAAALRNGIASRFGDSVDALFHDEVILCPAGCRGGAVVKQVSAYTGEYDHFDDTACDEDMRRLDRLVRTLSLADIQAFAAVSGDMNPSHVDDAFAKAGLQPDIVLSAMDADVIKTYVELGMGVGIVASIAFDAERDRTLRALDARHLFEVNLTRLAIRRGTWLRGYVYAFIEAFAPTLSRAPVRCGTMPEPRYGTMRGDMKRVMLSIMAMSILWPLPAPMVSMPNGWPRPRISPPPLPARWPRKPVRCLIWTSRPMPLRRV